MHIRHGRTNLHWLPHVAHKTFRRQSQFEYQRTVLVPQQKKRTIPLQKSRTILLSKNWGVPYLRTLLYWRPWRAVCYRCLSELLTVFYVFASPWKSMRFFVRIFVCPYPQLVDCWFCVWTMRAICQNRAASLYQKFFFGKIFSRMW